MARAERFIPIHGSAVVYQHAGGHRVILRRFVRHSQGSLQRERIRSEADFRFGICLFFLSHLHGRVIAFLLCGDELNRHHFPVVFLVFVGEIQIQILLFHAQMKYMGFELKLFLFKAAIAAELKKVSRHPLQIGQKAFKGLLRHIPTDLQVVIAPETAHIPSADIVFRILLDGFLRPYRNAVFHLLGFSQRRDRQHAHHQHYQRQNPCHSSSVHRSRLPVFRFIPLPYRRQSA